MPRLPLFAIAACALALNACTEAANDRYAPSPVPEEPLSYAATKSAAPLSAFEHANKGRQYLDKGLYGLAETEFRASVELKPHNAEAWLGLAAAYDNLRRFDLADRAYEQAIRIVGATPEILNNQGFSYMLRGSPGSGQPVDTLATFARTNRVDPMGYPSDSVAVGQDWDGSVVVRFDPRDPRPTFDTVLTGARFPSVSDNQQLIAYQTLDETRIVVTSFPTPGRRWQVASSGVEPIWLSPSELLYRYGAVWYLARIDPMTGEPQGASTFWARDPRFSDTSGWSNRPAYDGSIIYVQSPEQASPTFLRVIPDWVTGMKRAVDAANK